MKYRGVAYYPEYWPEERWAEDIRLMREAHINMVRVGEFAWTAMEPSEGNFTLEWLHRLVQQMGDAGISVMLCTPTATPPAWLADQYPHAILMQLNGGRMEHGRRRHYCPTSQVFRAHSRRITDVMSREFSRYSNVLWQLDNELGPESGGCYCDNCQAQYRLWLQKKYGSLDELNRRWGTRFWSVDYTDWGQVRLAYGDMYSSMKLDTQRFRSDSFVDFAREQTDIIRKNHQSAVVTTNGMGPIFDPINYYDLFAELDFAPDDLYFDIATMDGNAMAMDIYRNYKKDTPFWITETGSGALSADKCPTGGQVRCWAFSALARGCEGYNIFRWRTCLSGQEQELQGVIEYSGKPRRRYQTVKNLYTELESLWPQFESAPLPVCDVAIINDYQSLWAYQASRINNHVKYVQRFHEVYKAFYDRNIQVDVIPPDRDLSGYKVVVLPSVVIVSGEFAQKLREFVQAGGTVFSMPQLAWRDENNNYLPACAPGKISDIFGFYAEGGMYLRNFTGPDQALWVPKENFADETPGVKAQLAGGDVTDTVNSWMEDIELDGGTALGKFTDNDFVDSPVIVKNSFGKGTTLYTAAFPSVSLLGKLIDETLDSAGIAAGIDTPEYVEVLNRGEYTFIINHRAEPVAVSMPICKVIIGEYKDGKVLLGAHDLCLMRNM